jgi:hypothetical protein
MNTVNFTQRPSRRPPGTLTGFVRVVAFSTALGIISLIVALFHRSNIFLFLSVSIPLLNAFICGVVIIRRRIKGAANENVMPISRGLKTKKQNP